MIMTKILVLGFLITLNLMWSQSLASRTWDGAREPSLGMTANTIMTFPTEANKIYNMTSAC